MAAKEFILLLVILSCFMTRTSEGIKIAAFNVRTFGKKKLEDGAAMNVIVKIIRQYDIILIQEVRGVNLNPNVPMGLLQRVGNNDGNEYAICNEEYKFKGKTKYKEMYLFLYRKNTVECGGIGEVEDLNADFSSYFARPPSAAYFRTIDNGHQVTFPVIGIHTRPEDAEFEINCLVCVYQKLKEMDNNHDFAFIMGDFNYGGSYVDQYKMDNLQVDKVFVRLLDQNQKTTTKPGSDPKPYDRIYYVPPDSYKPFSVQLEAGVQTNRFGLTPKDYYDKVSDHYPVYVEMRITETNTNNKGKQEWGDPDWDNFIKSPALVKQLEGQSYAEDCLYGDEELLLQKEVQKRCYPYC